MGSVTNSVINEMKSELEEQLNDRTEKLDTGVAQAKSALKTIYSIFFQSIGWFFQGMMMLIILGLTLLDHDSLNALRNASNDDILSLVDKFSGLAWLVATVTLIASIVIGRIRFRHIRAEKEQAIKDHLELVDTVGTVAEEVLHRHGLIGLGERK